MNKPPPIEPTKRLAVRITAEQHQALQDLAKKLDRTGVLTVSTVARLCLSEGIQRLQQSAEKTL